MKNYRSLHVPRIGSPEVEGAGRSVPLPCTKRRSRSLRNGKRGPDVMPNQKDPFAARCSEWHEELGAMIGGSGNCDSRISSRRFRVSLPTASAIDLLAHFRWISPATVHTEAVQWANNGPCRRNHIDRRAGEIIRHSGPSSCDLLTAPATRHLPARAKIVHWRLSCRRA